VIENPVELKLHGDLLCIEFLPLPAQRRDCKEYGSGLLLVADPNCSVVE
jgi:hypothetical protein